MSERSTSGEDINQKVEEGIKNFEVFQKKLKSIVHALNEQHSSMIELNNNRMKASLEFLLPILECRRLPTNITNVPPLLYASLSMQTAKLLAGSFTENSPIAHVTGEARAPSRIMSAVDLTPCDPSLAGSCRVTVLGGGDFSEEADEDMLLPAGDGAAAPGLVEESVQGTSSSDGSQDLKSVISVELIESDHCTEASIKDNAEEIGDNFDCAADEENGEKLGSEDTNDDEEEEEEDDEEEVKGDDNTATASTGLTDTNALEDEASKKTLATERPKISTVDVYLSAFQLGEDHAKLFKTSIIDYVTEWYEIVTSRIKARTIEFTRLKANLLHYQKKVQGLDESTEKARRQAESTASKQLAPTDTSLRGMFNSMAMTRSDSTRNKLEAQLDRNLLKLEGAREVFTMYGQSLILLIDEVVNRAWRDVLPVLLRSINLDMQQSKSIASIYAASEALASELELLGMENAVYFQGRLKEVKELHPEEIYTGTESIVRPVLKSK